jgi:hypothetical protein
MGQVRAPGQARGSDSGHRRVNYRGVLGFEVVAEGVPPVGPGQMPQLAPNLQGHSLLIDPSGEYAYSPPAPEPVRPSAFPLKAFLSVDLRILKASKGFSTLLADGVDIRDRQLFDFVASQHHPALRRLQNDLRNERSKREPSFLPAIFPEAKEQDAVQIYDVENAEMLGYGYDDRSDIYTFLLAGGLTEQSRVRVRLTRTSTFFATMILQRLDPPQPSLQQTQTRSYTVAPPRSNPTPMSCQPPSPSLPFKSSVSNSTFWTPSTAGTTSLPPIFSSTPLLNSDASNGPRSNFGCSSQPRQLEIATARKEPLVLSAMVRTICSPGTFHFPRGLTTQGWRQ